MWRLDGIVSLAAITRTWIERLEASFALSSVLDWRLLRLENTRSATLNTLRSIICLLWKRSILRDRVSTTLVLLTLMVRIKRNVKEDLPLLRTLYLGSVTGYSCHAVSFCSKTFHPFVMRSSSIGNDSARLRVILWKWKADRQRHARFERFVKVSGFPLDLPRLTSIIGRERCFFNRKKVEITSWQRSEIDILRRRSSSGNDSFGGRIWKDALRSYREWECWIDHILDSDGFESYFQAKKEGNESLVLSVIRNWELFVGVWWLGSTFCLCCWWYWVMEVNIGPHGWYNTMVMEQDQYQQ